MRSKHISLFLIPLAGLLHWVRGRGIVKGDRWWMSGILGAGMGWLQYLDGATVNESSIVAGLVLVGVYFLLAGGWVQAFSSFHGRAPERRKGTFRFLDGWCDKLIKRNEDSMDWRAWGTLWACLRFGLGSIPLCIGMAAYHFSPWCAAFPLLFALCGLIMAAARWVPEKYAFHFFEPLIGAWIGVILWLGVKV